MGGQELGLQVHRKKLKHTDSCVPGWSDMQGGNNSKHLEAIIQVQFLITQLIISTHFDVSTAIGGLLQELNVQWSLLARWRGEQTVPHVT